MDNKFVSILRQPDADFGATEASPLRFEEMKTRCSDGRYGIKNYDKISTPYIFVSEDGSKEREFNWDSAYDGTRIVLTWKV